MPKNPTGKLFFIKLCFNSKNILPADNMTGLAFFQKKLVSSKTVKETKNTKEIQRNQQKTN